MKHIGKKAVSLTLAGALSLGLLAGCGSTEQTGGSEIPSGSESPAASSEYRVDTLRLEGGTDYGAPNPFLHNSRGPGAAKMRLVYGSLLEKDEEGDVSWLAESWSMDGSDYTFTLFENAQFQDGEPLTTADVAFTLDYYQEHPPGVQLPGHRRGVDRGPLHRGGRADHHHHREGGYRRHPVQPGLLRDPPPAHLGERGRPLHLHRRRLSGGQRGLFLHRLRRGHRQL